MYAIFLKNEHLGYAPDAHRAKDCVNALNLYFRGSTAFSRLSKYSPPRKWTDEWAKLTGDYQGRELEFGHFRDPSFLMVLNALRNYFGSNVIVNSDKYDSKWTLVTPE